MFTARQAAAALGIDQELLEEKLEAGVVPGLKKQILFTEKWFVTKAELDALLERRNDNLFDTAPEKEDEGVFDANPLVVDNHAPVDRTYEALPEGEFQAILSATTQEFSACLTRSLDLINELRRELQEKDIQLHLLTDMQKRTQTDSQTLADKEAELRSAELHIERLKERVNQLQSEKSSLKQLEEKISKLSRPWWQKLFLL
jgi:hypothetical protein